MKTLIIFIIVVVIIINGYTFLKYKRKKKKSVSNIDNFRNGYLKNRTTTLKPNQNPEKYTRYTTRYNSTVDYVEKDEFLKEAASHANPSSSQHDSKYARRNRNGLHNNFM